MKSTVLLIACFIQCATMAQQTNSTTDILSISQDFIYAAKTGDNTTDSLQQILSALPYDILVSGLTTDDQKKAFWINLYNGFTQLLLGKNPGAYKSRGRFFKSKQITVAGKTFSLDDIEHGILRHSKIKWSLGYFNKLFPNKTEKALRVDQLDYRIHFTLNCGAKSCPPIAFYDASSLDKQLNIAAKSYLKGECAYDSVKNIVHLPALMNWFRRDFGGKKKMNGLLQKLNIIPANSKPQIKFKKYDWSLFLHHYKTDN